MTAALLSSRVFLDHNATAPLRPEARTAALAALDAACNPSSVHAEGRYARSILERARGRIADFAGARPEGVVFTSGATEAAHLALSPDLSLAGRRGFARLIVSATEHAAVLHGHRFPARDVEILSVHADGSVDLADLEQRLAAGGPAVVAIQAANNETGVIQPLHAIATEVRAHGGLLVCDAVQAAGRISCQALGADILILSGHKLGGLAGAGAVVVGEGTALGSPVLRGGGQERGRRSGTENVAAIAAFGAAAEAATIDTGRLRAMRDGFEVAIAEMAPDVVIFGRSALRLPNTCAFAVPGVAAERLLMALDLAGIAVSSGSACGSGVVGRSHVLEAMGVTPDLRLGLIRVSLGWNSSNDDVDRVVEALAATLDRIHRRRFRSAA